MEIEETRGLINKKAFEDQLVTFCQFSFGALPLFSLSLMFLETQSFLGALLEGVAYLDFWSKKENEEKESARGHRDQQLQRDFLAGTKLHVCFPHQFWHAFHMHVDYW